MPGLSRVASRFASLAVFVSGALVTAGVAFAAPDGAALAPLPGADGGAAAAKPDAGITTDQVRKGVAQIERAGRPMAIGVVLANDGRVLTSLSGLGGLEQAEIRYADGSVIKSKLGHKDKTWDLALLVPESGKWQDGLGAAVADPQSAELKSFLPKAGKLSPIAVAYKGHIDARSKEGDPMRSVLEIDLKGGTSVPGAPLIDPSGRVAGVLVRACKDGPAAADAGAQACTPLVVGAPVYALRSFLMHAPAGAAMPAPWLGLGGAPSEAGNVRGVRVMGLAPGSPAAAAGLKAGGDAPDTIVAVDGQPVESPEQLAEVIAKRSIGQQIKLLVFSGGKFRDIAITLRAAP